MERSAYSDFIGIDLGGARGKSTALAHLRRCDGGVLVERVLLRSEDGSPWTDESLIDRLSDSTSSVVAVNAPLTLPACVRCTLESCPGASRCVDPAVVWLREEGQLMQDKAADADRDRIAAVPQSHRVQQHTEPHVSMASLRLPPYTHRCTEVALHFERQLLPRDHLGQASWAIATRAHHLRKALTGAGWKLHENLIEVSPRATVHALFGERCARGYKRDADPWHTRAAIVEGMDDVTFSPRSRMSREDVLRNDNGFEALISAYTAFLWAREGWELEAGPFASDGFIWAPPHS